MKVCFLRKGKGKIIVLNAFFLDGFVVNDLELRESKRSKYVKVILSIRSTKKNDRGETEAEMVYLTAFGDTARYLVENAPKGSRVNVSGRLQMARYISEPVCDVYGNELRPAKTFSYPQLIIQDADVTRKYFDNKTTEKEKDNELETIYDEFAALKG